MGSPSPYQTIDEPRVRPWDHLLVDPTIILFAAILVPLFWTPPLQGRHWMPMLWLIVNGWLLGSPTFLREVIYAVAGLALYFALPLAVFTAAGIGTRSELADHADQMGPYLRIVAQGIFFGTLYVIVFNQSLPYELHAYVKGSAR